MPEEQIARTEAAPPVETERPRCSFRIPPLSRRLPILTGIAAVAMGLEYGRFHLVFPLSFYLSNPSWNKLWRLDAPLTTAAVMILAGVGLVVLSMGRDVRMANGVAALMHLSFVPFVFLALGPRADELVRSLGLRFQADATISAAFLILIMLVSIRSARVLVRKPALVIALGIVFVAIQLVIVPYALLPF